MIRQLLLLMPIVVMTGCTVETREPVAVVEPGPPEYYFVGGRYYHWGPQERWVEVREVPRGMRYERVERLPDRPVRVETRGGRRVEEERR
ncbi:MAG TPA: hypothetical protein VFE58_19055 [Tepidisphaeraceae bacterium]|jgi:hypothetical protein|nr:hypothetical protein [Tepidisphaeraceae bacterium]